MNSSRLRNYENFIFSLAYLAKRSNGYYTHRLLAY